MGVRKTLNVLVVGGFADGAGQEEMTSFGQSLGAEIIRQGHTLVSGNRSEFDQVVADAAKEACGEADVPVDERIVSYVLADQDPFFAFGRQLKSQLTSWDPGKGIDFIPEPVQMADVIFLVKGGTGTRRAAHWGQFTNRPLLPITYFGGAAADIYKSEFQKFEGKYADFVDKLAYQTLNEIGKDWDLQSKRIVSLAEDLTSSESVVVAMSYSGDQETLTQLDNLFESFQIVCQEFRYRCERITEQNTKDRILPTILRKIELCGFLIVDLTDLKPNVFYELGFANGLNKNVVATARNGTELPFDVKDIPVTFWDPIDQKKLRSDIKERVELIAELQGKAI